MSDPRSWGENNAAIEAAKEEILQALMSAVADKLTLDKIFNGLGGENGISLVPNYTVLYGDPIGGSSDNPVVITGKGYIAISAPASGSVSSNVCYIEIDDNILINRETKFKSPIGGLLLPFSRNVRIYSNMTGVSYIAFLEE